MPLTDLLRNRTKLSRKPLYCSPACDAAFAAIKESLAGLLPNTIIVGFVIIIATIVAIVSVFILDFTVD